MPAIRGLTVAVGEWYASTLATCLPLNLRHLVECFVVTKPGDPCAEVARGWPGVHVLETDAFTRHGARLNKGLAIEELLSAMGRHGWICIHDADILFPDSVPWHMLRPDCIHGAKRRILADPSRWSPEFQWRTCPLHPDGGPIGFFQCVHADAPALAGQSYWYDPTFAHCGGGDARFLSLFPPDKRVMLPLEVLHLGPVDTNWFGCTPEGRDMMARFVTENNWRRAMRHHDPAAAKRAPEPPHRVEVPGFAPSSYELPFVRRAKSARP